MGNSIGLFLIAAVGGLAITLQGQFIGLLDRSFGTNASTLYTYASGAVVGLILALFLSSGTFTPKPWSQVPWYAFTVGILGLIIVGSISYTVPRLGLSVSFTVLVASQFITAMILEHFGWFGATATPIDWSKISGVGAIILGVWLITN